MENHERLNYNFLFKYFEENLIVIKKIIFDPKFGNGFPKNIYLDVFILFLSSLYYLIKMRQNLLIIKIIDFSFPDFILKSILIFQGSSILHRLILNIFHSALLSQNLMIVEGFSIKANLLNFIFGINQLEDYYFNKNTDKKAISLKKMCNPSKIISLYLARTFYFCCTEKKIQSLIQYSKTNIEWEKFVLDKLIPFQKINDTDIGGKILERKKTDLFLNSLITDDKNSNKEKESNNLPLIEFRGSKSNIDVTNFEESNEKLNDDLKSQSNHFIFL